MRLPLLLPLLIAAVLPVGSARAQDQVTICHATGSAENPYVSMTLDNQAALEHLNHEDDLVPAPAGGCPTTPVVEPEDTPVPTPTPTPAVVTATPTPTPTRTPRPRPPRDRRRDRDDKERARDRRDGGGVLGQQGSGGSAPMITAAPQRVQASDTGTQDLPMTGAEIWLIAAFGAGFVMSGSGLRLLSPAAGRPPGPSGR